MLKTIKIHILLIIWELPLLCIFPPGILAQDIIEINEYMPAPQWAISEQQLLKENLTFLELVTAKYINPITGHLECVEHWGGSDGPDDAMENFYNWSLLYALGAPKQTLDIFNFIWNGHIAQYTNSKIRDPRGSAAYYKEFISAFDWEHTGEGVAPFLLLPLSDPYNPKTQERIIKFANFYTGRDTSTHNYDPEHKIIRSVFNGSRGPWLSTTPQQILLNNNSWRSRGADGVMGDVPLNLISTSLAVNAYMITGDEHYKNWVLEYGNAWLNRTMDNHWIIPSNIGLNGIVGEHWEGKWYGGIMGWDWNFGGFRILGRGMRIGFGNAYFLGGDSLFLESLRRQGDTLLTNNEVNTTYLTNYGDEDWYLPLYAPLDELTTWYDRDRTNDGWYYVRSNTDLGNHFSDLYTWTWKQTDFERISKTAGSNSDEWFAYLQGKNPGYPEVALEREFTNLARLTDNVNNDNSNPAYRRSDHGPWPAATNALVNLTMGGLQPTKSGGLLFCQLRYFNPTFKRPGLPADVGALISFIDKDKLIVTLVNTNDSVTRDVIVQTGAYGEHQCSKIILNDTEYPVDTNRIYFRLAPGSGSTITIYLHRNCNKPTLLFPWVHIPPGYLKEEATPASFNIIPNPVVSNTHISFYATGKNKIRISIYNALGMHIETLCDETYDEGMHEIIWNPGSLHSGVCFCIIDNGKDDRQQKKLIIKR